ncbi:MAG: hypothetical protein ACOX9B_00110 [Candidatus Xenobium sp.]|jgi:hypothetical protein
MRMLVGALGGWLTALSLAGGVACLAGGSSESVRTLLPDQWVLRAGFGVSDAPLALSLLHGLVLLALAARMPTVRRPTLALVLGAALAVNGLGLELSGFRLARQVRNQWGWSDQQIREAWHTWQGFDPRDFQVLRERIRPQDSVLFRIDDSRPSQPLAVFLGYALLPSPSHLAVPQRSSPPPTDWVVDIRNGRVVTTRRSDR